MCLNVQISTPTLKAPLPLLVTVELCLKLRLVTWSMISSYMLFGMVSQGQLNFNQLVVVRRFAVDINFGFGQISNISITVIAPSPYKLLLPRLSISNRPDIVASKDRIHVWARKIKMSLNTFPSKFERHLYALSTRCA